MRYWLCWPFLLVHFVSSSGATAQDSTRAVDTVQAVDSTLAGVLNIIVDCSSCDQNYFRTEIAFVNFVRDRALADVNILITRQTTGSLGREHTLEFIGRREYANMRDTLRYISLQSDSDDDIRNGLVKTIKLGLMRYVSRTNLGKDVEISYSKPSVATEIKDPWNFWTFSISSNGWMSGQKSTSRFYISNQLSARRTTEQVKIDFYAYSSYEENNYDFVDFKLKSIARGRGASASVVWSLGGHWSAGFESNVSGSTYSNTKINVNNSAALEYNVFPYKESTRRQLRLQYWLSEYYYEFRELTIFDKHHSWLTRESVSATLSYIQPWGSASGGLSASHYFHDFDKNRLTLNTDLSLKLVKGFSLTFNGYISWIHDQISLKKGDASQDEILLQRRQLATSYDYWASFGISYTFGSIYNTIVNPRFGN